MAKGDEQTNKDENACNKTHSFLIPESARAQKIPLLCKKY
jgi:hypothetical protein